MRACFGFCSEGPETELLEATPEARDANADHRAAGHKARHAAAARYDRPAKLRTPSSCGVPSRRMPSAAAPQ